MDQQWAEEVLASRHMPHGIKGLASLPESELQHPRVDLGMLRESLEGSPLRHTSAGRGPNENYSQSRLGVEVGRSAAGDPHYRDEDLVYCGSHYGLHTAEQEEEAVLCVLTTKFPGLPLPDVEDLEVARFCKAKQDRPHHLRCPKGTATAGGGIPPGDGDGNPMGEEVASAGLGGGDRAANVGPFPEVVEEMGVNEDQGLLPLVVPAFSAPLPSVPLAGLPPHGASLAEVQRLHREVRKPDSTAGKCDGQRGEDERPCGRTGV